MDPPNVDANIGRDIRGEESFYGGKCPIEVRTLLHTSDREVRRELPGLPDETYRPHGLLDAPLKIGEPVEVAIQSNPEHAWGAARREDAWPAQGQTKLLLVADGLPDSRFDSVDSGA